MTQEFQDGVARAPYPGLRAFRRDETDLFFGREGCVNAMIDRLAATRFLAVLGSSGSGKSSLVKTGLLDGLELGLMAGVGSHWRIVDFRPGGAPLRNLARGLLTTADDGSEVEPAASDVDLLRAFLDRGPRSMIEWCRSGHLSKGTNLFLLVDQFEELFRYQDYPGREEAEAFVSLLLESSRTREFPVYVAITMRSEFLGACALIEGLADAINAGMYLTPRMTREQCREAIVGPAAVCDIDIEPALVNRLLNDIANFAPWDAADAQDQLDRIMRRADQLPLLQYTLNRMWLRARTAGRDERVRLATTDYDAIGGLSGALNAHADQIVEELGKMRQTIVESVFRTITAGNNVAEAVRRPTRFADLVAACGGDEATVRMVVDAFRSPGVNFLVPEFDPARPTLAGDTYIDISHESLIRQWKRLGEWLDREANAAQQWRRLIDRHGTSELLRGRELANMLAWRADIKPNATWAKRYGGDYPAVTAYLENSYRVQRRKRLFIGGNAAAVFLMVAASAIVARHYEEVARERLADNQTMLRRTQDERERADFVKDNLKAFFENRSAIADQRTKSGATNTSDESVAAIRRFVTERPDDAEMQDLLAYVLNFYGDDLVKANDIANAHKAFEESLEIGRKLVQRNSDRFQWQEVLAAALGRLAQVQVKTNALAEARPRFEEAVALLRKLIERNEAEKLLNSIQTEKLLNSFQSQLGQLGDLLTKLEDSPAALKTSNERVDVYRKLVVLAPDDTSRLENLSSGLDRAGGLLLRLDDLAAARTAFEEEVQIDRDLNRRDPNNRSTRRNLAFSMNRIADLSRRENKLDAARDLFESIVAINRKLVEEFPRDEIILNDHQLRLGDYAQMLEKLGDKQAALAVYREQLDVRRRHLALAGDNIVRLRSVSAALDKVGELLLQAESIAEARQAFAEEVEIDSGLYQRDAEDLMTRRNLAFSLWRIAELQRRERDFEGARRTYQDVVSIYTKLAADFPRDADVLNIYQSRLGEYGALLVQMNDRTASLDVYKERLEAARKLLAITPENPDRMITLATALLSVGDVMAALENRTAALAIYREGLEVRRKLLVLAPDDVDRAVNVSASLDKIGGLLLQMNDLPGASVAFDEELEFDRKLYARNPNGKTAQQNLVFTLNRVADLSKRQYDRGRAARIYGESLGIDRQLSASYPDEASVQEKYASNAKQLADLLLAIANIEGAKAAYGDQFAGLMRLIYIRRKAFVAGGSTMPESLGVALGEATWAGLLSNHPREVIDLADDALKLDPTRFAVEVNRATALLLSGRVAEARTVYDKLGKTPHPNDARLSWIESVKEDLALLRRLGISNPDVEQVARDLGI